MAFTEEQLSEQRKMFEELKEEMSRMNSDFEAQLKSAGLTPADLQGLSLEDAPPEVKKMLDQAQDAAKRTGEARAEQARQAFAPRPASSGPSRRRNIIKF